jgi:hypothetical protein
MEGAAPSVTTVRVAHAWFGSNRSGFKNLADGRHHLDRLECPRCPQIRLDLRTQSTEAGTARREGALGVPALSNSQSQVSLKDSRAGRGDPACPLAQARSSACRILGVRWERRRALTHARPVVRLSSPRPVTLACRPKTVSRPPGPRPAPLARALTQCLSCRLSISKGSRQRRRTAV